MIKWKESILIRWFSVKKTIHTSTGYLFSLLFVLSGCSSVPVIAANTIAETSTPVVTATSTALSIPTNTPKLPTPTLEVMETPDLDLTTPTGIIDLAVPLSMKQPSAEGTAVPVDENGLPLSHYIYGIAGHKQYFKLGCEAAVTHDWAWFFGYHINEFEFQNKLPLSDNPEEGFVGSVDSKWGQAPPYAYGVHAAPVAQLLHEYGVPAIAVKGMTLMELKQQIAAGRPVIAWVIGNVVGGIPHEYTAKDGKKVIVAAYEHVVIVTGYSETHIRYNNNGKYFDAPTDVFLNSWKVLGNMALIAGK